MLLLTEASGDPHRPRRVSAVLDDTLLADEERLLAADREGTLRTVATAGAQVRATWRAARDAGVDTELVGLRPRALVLLARPGAGRRPPGSSRRC